MSQQSAATTPDDGGDVAARNKYVLRACFDAWRAGTGGPFDLPADDATWTIVGRSAAAKTYRNRESFMAEVGVPDVLVNNAGVQHRAPINEFPGEDWDRVVATPPPASQPGARSPSSVGTS